MEATEILAQSVDKSQVPPLHQKRILAFVNHFLISSCAFLNDFAQKCEYRFIDLERKLQKVEASLIIIEAKLSSIPNNDSNVRTTKVGKETTLIGTPEEAAAETQQQQSGATELASEEGEASSSTTPVEGVQACSDVRYKKFFKMLQFGVPAEAVKMKMKAEGMDATILDTPNAILADGSSC